MLLIIYLFYLHVNHHPHIHINHKLKSLKKKKLNTKKLQKSELYGRKPTIFNKTRKRPIKVRTHMRRGY